MKRYLLDSNFLLRYLLKDIPHQASLVRNYFLQAKKREIEITIPIVVFQETLFALTKLYNFNKSSVAKKLTEIAEISYLDIEDRDILTKALSAYSKSSLSFIDLFLYFKAKMKGRELLTFDKKLVSLKIE